MEAASLENPSGWSGPRGKKAQWQHASCLANRSPANCDLDSRATSRIGAAEPSHQSVLFWCNSRLRRLASGQARRNVMWIAAVTRL
ncbi:hypothetical protein D8674_006275 [Pyrus ussuriensis x Pyrus communis]|uniref:Uncharacterized protein n=1 Tax=Pyrus ussuriensis x Pyrus communis TaxID=2448454 RepID=A0A5N5FTU6_9ROSA|nr:hypothetical protein D8674_006275 [Pyrus ussuriensis x Pyrus communis]